MKTVWANTIVRNDERWIWYAISSIIDHVEKVLIWDTGSTDKTPQIIEELTKKYPNKIYFKEVNNADPHEFSLFRQEMLEESKCDWVMVLDSDEIWSEDSASELVDAINKNNADVIIATFINFIGDIFHYQDRTAGRYSIDGKVGNLTVKAFRKNIEGLKVSKDYGSEGYIDKSGKFLQESNLVKREFIGKPFLHATHLSRSSKDSSTMGRHGKVKHELGKEFPYDFFYPEALFRAAPKIVKSPWKVMDKGFRLISILETPLRKMKRLFIK